MRFHITQSHPPDQYPNYCGVEVEILDAAASFLMPGFKCCTSKVTPVSPGPILKGEGSGRVKAKRKEYGKDLP
jgi:hypothetical protein